METKGTYFIASPIVKPEQFLGLKREYELIAGKISPRTWQRVRGKIGLEDIQDELQRVALVRTYALLRKYNRTSLIDMSAVARSIYLAEFLEKIDGFVEGQDLFNAFRKWGVSECTLRRWGKQIGCPFYLLAWYKPEDVQRYVQRLSMSVKFSPVIKIPRTRRIA